MTIKNPTLRRRTKGLAECAEDARESQLLGYELKDVGNLIVTMTMHMTDLQNKVDSQAEHIKMLNKKLEQTPTGIVRCGECKHRYYADNRVPHERTWVCERFSNEEITDNDFCSFGERSEE